jgi:hypothetical protein
MKKIITLFFVATFTIVTNNVIGQEPVSLGLAPNDEFQPWSIPANYAGSRGFTYTGVGPYQLNKQSLGSTTLTPLGSPESFGLPAACTINPSTGDLYVIDMSSPYPMYKVDTTSGALTFLFYCTGIPQSSFTGITWNQADGQMYGVSTNTQVSSIFTINMATGACTTIGTPSDLCVAAISISASKNGSLFVICVSTDALYKFDKITGEATLVGSLGVSINSAQDAQFDLGDDQLYWASHTSIHELRIIDTTDASSTVIGQYSEQVFTLGIYPKFVGMPKISEKDDINIYPNPANKIVNIKTQNIESLKVINIENKIMDQKTVNNNSVQIDISNYNPGVYFIQGKTDKGIFTRKIIVTK